MRATLIAVMLLAVGAARAEAGGPTIEMKDCTVHKVEAEGNKVVFTVSGRCALLVPDPDREKGRMKWVDTTLERCVITAVDGEVYRTETWAEYQDRAKALAGKTAWMQLRGATTLDDGRVASVRCTSALFGPARPKP
jgi:hypothetical protein